MRHLETLLPGMHGVKQLLDVCVVLLCLVAVFLQQLLEESLLHLQPSFQLLHDLTGAQRNLTEESRGELLQDNKRDSINLLSENRTIRILCV